MKVLFFTLALLFISPVFSQYTFSFKIVDSETSTSIIGAKVYLKGASTGAKTDLEGIAKLTNIPEGDQVIVIESIGFELLEFPITFPTKRQEPQLIEMTSNKALDEVIIEATRSNKSVANLPTRTEVLTEEIDEAASMEPSKISHLITHSTGIQVQTTSAGSNGAVVRIQGLNGRYTQMLKDGFPLYGGFSGSLDILQIPPLDLRQVEYIKGPASTLYGAGAIGGIINLLSKKPEQEETLLHINLSHIGAKDFNFFASRRFGKFGFTNLASFHTHSAYDPDNDGYADVPQILKLNFNPRLFYYPDSKTEFYLGAMISNENRKGGDMTLIDKGVPDFMHYYFDYQESKRYTSQSHFKRELGESGKLTVKNSVSLFDRYIHIRQDVFGNESKFAGQQLNSFSELNYSYVKSAHNLNLGLNLYTDEFTELQIDTSMLRDQSYITYGAYANHLWDITKKWALESGMRFDYATAKGLNSTNPGQFFVLPRLSALWKVAKPFSIRLGGGMGYRMPTIFNEEAEPYGYQNITPIDFGALTPEQSYGGNIDFKFLSDFGTNNILLSLNQMFFYNLIDNPILLNGNSSGGLTYDNYNGQLNSRGFESQVKLTFWKFTWFLGYTYTDAFIAEESTLYYLTLTPKHSVKGDILFVEENKWRIGLDYEYKSSQFLSNGLSSRSLFTSGIVVERTLNDFVIFLNAENFTDTRQSKYETTLSGPYNTPQFTEIYAPLEGFFFNAGLKIKL